jgi:hypothetical protein
MSADSVAAPAAAAPAAPAPFFQSSTHTAHVPTALALPNLETASSAEIMQARREGKIDNYNWPRYEARMLKEHGDAVHKPMPVSTAKGALGFASAAQMQDAADEGEKSAALVASVYAPAKAEDFKSLIRGPDPTPESLAADAELRSAMSQAQFPVHVGNAVVNEVETLARELGNAKQPAIEKHMGNFNAAMRDAWGDQAPTRLKAVDVEILKVAAKSPYLMNIIDRAPYLLASPMLAQQIWGVIEYRAKAAGSR